MESGERFGEYRLGRRLGRGGQGEVYEATCGLNLTWAVKIGHSAFTDDPKALRRVAEEAVWVNEMFHKIPRNCGILAGEHYGVIDRRFYVKMRLLRGESLAERIRGKGALPVEEALAIARSVASAVALAHQHQALHHDIKPANIFLERDATVQVLDWGCVRLVEAGRISGSTTGGPTCTVGYAALEQYDPSRDVAATAADVYSLGVVLFEMLTGANPFLAREHEKRTRTQRVDDGVAVASRGAESAEGSAHLPGQGETVPMAPIASDKVRTAKGSSAVGITGRTWKLSELSDALDPEATTAEVASELFPAPGLQPINSVAAILRYQAVFDVRHSQLVVGLPVLLVELLSRMLAPDARLRLTDMAVVVAELERLLTPPSDVPVATWHGPKRRDKARGRAWRAAGIAALMVAGYVAFRPLAPEHALETVAASDLPAPVVSHSTHAVDLATTPEVVTTAAAVIAIPSAIPNVEAARNVAPVAASIEATTPGQVEATPPAARKPSKRRPASAPRPKVLFEADERQ
jgi:serine/threonine protein kinase